MWARRGLIVLLLLGVVADWTVFSRECPSEYFGHNCQYKCHCAQNGECDVISGNCSTPGCAEGWMGPLCQYANVAYDHAASAFPVLNSPYLAVDGDLDTCFETLATSGAPSWHVDMERNHWVSWIRIYTATPSDLEIELDRLDGFGNVITSICNSSYLPRPLVSIRHLDIVCEEPILTRWLKIIRHASSSPRLQLCEVEVSGGRNIALRKRTYQSSTWSGPDFINGTLQAYNFTSDLAVDGDSTTDFSRGSCTVTNVLTTSACREGTMNPSWAVDLGLLYDIYRIAVFNRGDPGLTNRLGGFSLLTSGPEYMEIYRDITNSPAIVTEVVAPGNLTADGVLVRLFGCRILTLCELEVYGDCQDGSYGLECNKTCRCLDADEPCGKLDGQCLSGCRSGFTGVDCTQVCPAGTFGPDCNETCNDNCLRDACHPSSGRCTEGCEPGWIGPLCAEGCPEGLYGPQCLLPCSPNCRYQICHATNGNCTYGCAPGWIGVNCHREVIGLPFFEERSILIGALVGAFIFVIGLIIVIIILKRRSEPVYSCREAVYSCRDAERRRKITEQSDAPKVPESAPSLQREVTSSPKIAPNTVQILTAHLDTSVGEDGELTGDEEVGVPRGDEGGGDEGGGSVEYYNLNIDKSSETSIRVTDFPTYMDKWRNNKYFFQHRFVRLPRDHVMSRDTASKDMNRHKNRYLNILPYDHCRVVLDIVDGDQTSDYINASEILSYNKKTQYIASQGPNKAILSDFIRMVWEKQVENIVMLTNLVEEGRRKCEPYWDTQTALKLGDMTVHVVLEEVRAHFTVRTLRLAKDGKPDRTVIQFHFTAWPDKGVPQSPWSLVHFRHWVQTSVAKSPGPVVVHCSAGVGRTGTFIALENLLEEAAVDDDIDVFVAVWKLRQQRVNMVQTLDQYIFLHEALLAALVTSKSYLTPKILMDQFHVVTSENAHIEFKDLKTCPTVSSEREYLSAKETENRRKNRYCNILPSDPHRPRLHTVVPDGNDYINAVFLPSFRHPRGFLLSQTPLPSTVCDLWRLVYEHDIRTIVMIDDIDKDQHAEDVGVYWPEEGEELEIDPFTVSCLEESGVHAGGMCVRKLQLAKSESVNTTRDIRQLHCTAWPDTCDIPPYDVIKSCVDAVRIEGATHPDDPVLILCRDGAKRSGAFCVLVQLLEELETYNCVNLPLVVGGYRAVRQQIVSHLKQYEACYELLRHHLRLYPDLPDRDKRGTQTNRRDSGGPIYMNQ